MGFGLLSKYTAIALLPALVVILIIFPEQRHWFKSVYPYLALLIMMIVFWPVICWNQSNNWASLQFQFSERAARTKPFQVKYFLQLLASQLALLTPLIFFWFIRLSNDIKKVWHKNRTVLFYFISGIFLIGGFILISLKSQVKMNWLMPGYLGLIIALVLFYHSSINIRSLSAKIAAAFSIVLIITAYLLPMVPNVPIGEGNTWSGWSDAAKKIYNYQQEKGGNEKCFIFANSYKSASLLKFYLPGQQDTYAENIYNRPALQFDIWGTPQQLKGKDALFVFTDRKEYKNDIKYVQPFFDSLELFQEFEYKFAGKLHTRTIYCYYAKNYHGKN